MSTTTNERVLARGVLALIALEGHHDNAGVPVLGPRACADCMRYVAAVLRGSDPEAAVHLRCRESQRWLVDIAVALDLAYEVARDV